MSTKIKVIATVLFVALSSFTALHKYYVSVTDVEYDATSKALQITSRIFIDDLEKALQERYDDSLKIDDKKSDFYINKYFTKKLLIDVNTNSQKLKYIGKEFDDDMVHCYFEIENVPEISTIKITNKLLLGSYESQQNITHLKVNKKKKSFLLIKDKPSGMLKL